jgi:hypothetical protein
MTIDRIFFGYMALVGIAVGAIVVAAPRVQDFLIKPYFWVQFEGGAYLRGGSTPSGRRAATTIGYDLAMSA